MHEIYFGYPPTPYQRIMIFMYTFEYGKKLLKGKDSLEKMKEGIFLHCYIMNLSGKAQKIVGKSKF